MSTPKPGPAGNTPKPVARVMVFRAAPAPKPSQRSKAYRKADKRVQDAIDGLYTANPPAQLPALDSDRVTIVARLVRERDADPAGGASALPPKPLPRLNPRPLNRHKVIESIDALDEADRPRSDWEPDTDEPRPGPPPANTSRRRSRSAIDPTPQRTPSPSPTPMPVPRSRTKRVRSDRGVETRG